MMLEAGLVGARFAHFACAIILLGSALFGLYSHPYGRTMVRWDHWASDFCRIASNSARSMIGGCSPGRISFLYLTSPI